MIDLKKLKVIELKEILKKNKSKHKIRITGLKKADLIKAIESLNLHDIEPKKEEIIIIKKKEKKNKRTKKRI